VTVTDKTPPAIPQHLLLDGVSWDYYEHTLDEIGDLPMRVTFFRGRMEIMSPLPEHEELKKIIALLIESFVIQRGGAMRAFGSTTFRQEEKQGGLEPDECYYFKNERLVRGMKRFDRAVHPPPDLAVEIDVTRRSIPRQPIYAALGVPELWRYDGTHLSIHILSSAGNYEVADSSPTFPFLPIQAFEKFIHRMENEEQASVLREFQTWATSL
jgi:Uma2 family endonuclease